MEYLASHCLVQTVYNYHLLVTCKGCEISTALLCFISRYLQLNHKLSKCPHYLPMWYLQSFELLMLLVLVIEPSHPN